MIFMELLVDWYFAASFISHTNTVHTHYTFPWKYKCKYMLSLKIRPTDVLRKQKCMVNQLVVLASIVSHDRQGGLACCDSWGREESDTTERLNWDELNATWGLPSFVLFWFCLWLVQSLNQYLCTCGFTFVLKKQCCTFVQLVYM